MNEDEILEAGDALLDALFGGGDLWMNYPEIQHFEQVVLMEDVSGIAMHVKTMEDVREILATLEG